MDFLSLDTGGSSPIYVCLSALVKVVEKRDFPQATGHKLERKGRVGAVYINM